MLIPMFTIAPWQWIAKLQVNDSTETKLIKRTNYRNNGSEINTTGDSSLLTPEYVTMVPALLLRTICFITDYTIWPENWCMPNHMGFFLVQWNKGRWVEESHGIWSSLNSGLFILCPWPWLQMHKLMSDYT